MKWTIRVELTPDGNPPITYEIGTITRPIADLAPEQIGLTLEEGQQILRRVQVRMISSQAHAYALCRQPCLDRGRPRRVKDTRTKCVQAIFGAFRFRGRRYRACGCCKVANALAICAKVSRSVKSSRCGQHRRYDTCSPSLAPRCRIGRRPRFLGVADSGICARATWPAAHDRYGPRTRGPPAGLGRGAGRPSAGVCRIAGRWNRRHLCKASRAAGCTPIPSHCRPG